MAEFKCHRLLSHDLCPSELKSSLTTNHGLDGVFPASIAVAAEAVISLIAFFPPLLISLLQRFSRGGERCLPRHVRLLHPYCVSEEICGGHRALGGVHPDKGHFGMPVNGREDVAFLPGPVPHDGIVVVSVSTKERHFTCRSLYYWLGTSCCTSST
jgi:hypothetical protein